MSVSIAGELVILAEAQERERCAEIVREEWHRAVREFRLKPGSRIEIVIARILERVFASHKGTENG